MLVRAAELYRHRDTVAYQDSRLTGSERDLPRACSPVRAHSHYGIFDRGLNPFQRK